MRRLILIAFLAILSGQGFCQEIPNTIKSSISCFKYNKETSRRSEVPIERGRYRISLISATVDSQVEFSLEALKIYSNDVDIYVLLYELNPGIRQIADVASGTKIVFPKFEMIDNPLGASEFFLVHLNDSLKQVLIRTSQEIPSQKLLGAAFESACSNLNVIASAVRERSHPISFELLGDVVKEAKLLQTMGQQKNSSGVESIHADLKEKAENFRDVKGANEIPVNSNVPVIVTVLQKSNKAPLPGYRIYYVGAVLFNEEPYAISKLTPVPLTDFIPEGTWKVWGVAAGKPAYPPSTEVLDVRLRVKDNSAKQIDLFLK